MRRRTIRPKSAQELQRMRVAGRIVGDVLDAMGGLVAPGISTEELDAEAEALIRRQGASPSFKGYHGYPASICTSVNDEMVHGIPGPRRLCDGDIVSIDAGAIWEGYQGDAARTFAVGAVSAEVARLIEVTKASLQAGISAARSGQRLGDISHAIEGVAREAGFEVIREYGGHGIGAQMHEPPQVYNWGPAGRGILLRSGMTLALEPMLSMGTYQVRQQPDGWTVVTTDGSLCAHFEHTVAVTEQGGEVLTFGLHRQEG